MKIQSSPFSLFDFLGYFVPGFFIITSVGFGYYVLRFFNIINEDMPFLAKYLYLIKQADTNIFFVLFIVITSYILGHLTTFCSSLLIERYTIWVYNYPSKSLLGINQISGIKDLLEQTNFYQKIWRVLTCIILLPLVIIDLTISEVMKLKQYHNRPLDGEMPSVIFRKIELLYNNKIFNHSKESNANIIVDNVDFFQPMYHLLLSNSEKHAQKTQNYVAIYGLLRNLTLICISVFWASIIFATQNENLKTLIFLHPFESSLIYFIFLILIYIFFIGYLKFYRRYSSEVLYGILSIEHAVTDQSAATK